MVVVTLINTTSTLSSSSSLLQLPNNTRHFSSANTLHFYTFICRPTSPSLLYLRQLCRTKTPTKPNNCGKASSSSNGVLLVKGYMEESNSVSGFANKVIGALPLIGLFARIFSDVGGVGGDIIDFAEFRRRVGNNSSVNDSRAFYEFQERRGRVNFYILLIIWVLAFAFWNYYYLLILVGIVCFGVIVC